MTSADALLVSTARDLFADLAGSGAARTADGEWAASAWDVLAATGLATAGVTESVGGPGGTPADLIAVLGLAGEFALPLPVAENGWLAGWLLGTAGLRLPDGSAPVTVAPGRPRDTMTAERSRGGWSVSGRLERVPWAHNAGHLVGLVPVAAQPDTHVVAVVAREDYDVVPGQNLAGERRDIVVVTRAELEPTSAALSSATTGGLLLHGAASRCVLIAGAVRATVRLTLKYAGDRTQFGRSLATFQAVGHMLAQLAEQSAVADIAAAIAVRGLGRMGLGAIPTDVALGKASAARAATDASRLAHQIHGAMGVTAEYELQRLTRRLLAWRDEYGSETRWNSTAARELTALGSRSAWDLVIGATAPHSERQSTG